MLRRSLALAEPGGFVRTFVDLGAPLVRLMGTLTARDGRSPYVERLLVAFGDHPTASTQASRSAPRVAVATPVAEDPILEPLTERELEVLGGLQRRLSNKEIAEELAISPLTVKRHASNIYGKLGVASRRQAIRRVSTDGLLPTG